MKHFESRDLMVAVLPERIAAQECGQGCTNEETPHEQVDRANDRDLAGLQSQLEDVLSQ